MQFTTLVTLVGAAFSAVATEDYVQQAATSMEINLSSGVYTERAQVSAPLKLRIPTGTNAIAYGACLRIQGRDPSRNFAKSIDNLRECQQVARAPRVEIGSATTGLRIANEVGAVSYESCLKHRIDVEVFLPTASAE